MNRKTKIILLISIVAGGATYLIIRKIRGNKIYEELMKNLKTGANKTGTTKDIKEGVNNWASVTYWAKEKPDLKNKEKIFKELVEELQIKINSLFSSAESVFDTIKKVKTQAESSYLSYWYSKTSPKKTYLQAIQGINKDISAQIVKYLNSLPAK